MLYSQLEDQQVAPIVAPDSSLGPLHVTVNILEKFAGPVIPLPPPSNLQGPCPQDNDSGCHQMCLTLQSQSSLFL